jgi:hypothetical protein
MPKSAAKVELKLTENTVPPGNRVRSSALNLLYVAADPDFAAAQAIALGSVFTLTW